MTGAAGDASPPSYPGHGILLILVAIGCFSSMTASVKYLSADYSVFQIIFFRNIVPLPIVLAVLLYKGGVAALRSHRPGLQLVRNLLGVTSNLCLFFALGYLALSDATAIQFTNPLMVTALSALVLGDRVGPRRWCAVALGFAAVLLMVSPTGNFEWASLVLLFATFCYALMVIVTRILSRNDPVLVILFYLSLIGAITGGIALPFVWITPTPQDLWILLLVGMFGPAAQLFMVMAVKWAPPMILAPFDYTLMLWAVGFDILLWQIYPSNQTLFGAAIIAAAGLYVAQRETRIFDRLLRALRARVSNL